MMRRVKSSALEASAASEFEKRETNSCFSEELLEINNKEKQALKMTWSESVSAWKRILEDFKKLSASGCKEASKKLPEIQQKLTTAQIFTELKRVETYSGWEESSLKYKQLLSKTTQVTTAWQADFRSRVEKDLKITDANVAGKKLLKKLEDKESAIWNMPWEKAQKAWKKHAGACSAAKSAIGLPEKYKAEFAKREKEAKENANLSSDNLQGKKALTLIQKKKNSALKMTNWGEAEKVFSALENECSSARGKITATKYKEKIIAEYKEIKTYRKVCQVNTVFDSLRASNSNWENVLGGYKKLKARAKSLPVGKLLGEINESIDASQKNLKAKQMTETAEKKIDYAVAHQDWDISKDTHQRLLAQIQVVKSEKLTEKRAAELRGVELTVRRNIRTCTNEIAADKRAERGNILQFDSKKEEEKNKKQEIEKLASQNPCFGLLYSTYLYLSQQMKDAKQEEKALTSGTEDMSQQEVASVVKNEKNPKDEEMTLDMSGSILEGENIAEQQEKLKETMKKKGSVSIVSSKEKKKYTTYKSQEKHILMKMQKVLEKAGINISRDRLEFLLSTGSYSDIHSILRAE